jgi:hypothetical protein
LGSTQVTGHLRRAASLVLVAAIAVGCSLNPSRDPRDTTGIDLARDYLTAVRDDPSDRGWSLLHPDTRRDLFADDRSAYLRLVDASDLSGFEWQITDGVWESFDLYFAWVRVPTGASSIPRVLRDAGGWSLLHYDEGSGIGQVNVLAPLAGPAGVTASGVAAP